MGRTQKSVKNIAFGFGAQGVTTLIHFLTKSIIARMLGAQIVAMNGLFTEIIACLALAELGIGDAIVYNLYKPLAEDDHEKVSQLMTFFKQAYRVIALAVLGMGTIACFFVQFLMKGSEITYPMWFIRTIFMLFVVNSASSYLFSYKISLLYADQKAYLYSFYNTIFYVVRMAINIGVLFLVNRFGDAYSYIWYLSISIITTLISNYLLSRQVDKRYTYLQKIPLPKEGKKTVFDNVKNIFIKEVSGKITSSTDNILISVLVSTIMVAPNQFYITLTGVFKSLISQVETGIKASMGNLFAVGSVDDCKRVINRLTWGYMAFSIWGCTGLFVCSESFISVWVGRQYLYSDMILFTIILNLYCFIICRPIYTAMHVSGFFKEGRNISIAGSVVNLIVSIVFGKMWGIIGIFLGTFCTYLIQTILKIYYVYKLKFKSSCADYGTRMTMYTVLLIACMFGCKWLTGLYVIENDILRFFVNGAVSSVVVIAVIVVLFARTAEFKYYFEMAKGITKKFKRK
ncbi:MAG: hypothetical protein J5717_05990 [Lachnospiraceae bacterium]|nr:hypothetical protein [Lachnospiraceae bacterium]